MLTERCCARLRPTQSVERAARRRRLPSPLTQQPYIPTSLELRTLNLVRNNLIGLVGLLVGLVGIALSIYFYTASLRARQPVFVQDPVRSVILSPERLAKTPIRVVGPDGRTMTKDLVSTRFYFWNAGEEPIRKEDVLTPIRVSLGEGASLVDVNVAHISREVTGFSVSTIGEPPVALQIDFDILEHNDGSTVELLFTGNPDTSLGVSGQVVGARRITRSPDLQAARFWYEYAEEVGITLGAIILVAGFGVFSSWITDHFPLWRSKLSKRANRIIIITGKVVLVLLGLACVGVFVVIVAVAPARRAKTKARQSVIQVVPGDIMPPSIEGARAQ